MRIAVIGLGVMGLPMSVNLVRAGFEVVGYTRTRQRGEPLEVAGGRLTDTLDDAVRGAQAVITVLPDSPDVLDVYTGSSGVFATAASETLLLDMSTIDPAVARSLHQQAAEAAMVMLDAPVSGGQQGAENGNLSIMCGGTQSSFERARPVLDAMGTTVVLVGGAGSGQTVKAANQLMVAGHLQLLAEAVVFLDAHHVDLHRATEVLAGGLAGSTVLTRKGPAMLAGDFTPGFRVELHHKDLGIYCAAAREKGVYSPAGTAVAGLMGTLRSSGQGELDHSALLAQVAQLSGSTSWVAP